MLEICNSALSASGWTFVQVNFKEFIAMKQLLTLLLWLFTIEIAFSQDILINSGRTLVTPVSPVNVKQLSDSLERDPKITEYVRTIVNRPIYALERFETENLLETLRPVNETREQQLRKGLRNRIAAQQNQARLDAIMEITRERDGFARQIQSDRRVLEQLRTKAEHIRDSLTAISSALPQTHDQIRQRLFKLTNIHTLFDTSYTYKARTSIIDSLAIFAAQLDALNEDLSDLKRLSRLTIEKADEAAKALVAKLPDIDTIASRNSQTVSTMDSTTFDVIKDEHGKRRAALETIGGFIQEQQRNLQQLALSYQTTVKRIGDANSTSVTLYKASADYINRNLKEAKPKSSLEEVEFGAFPNVSYILGDQRALNLNIGILGAYSSIDTVTFSRLEARLFTGSVPKNLANPRSLFIPEASTFGTQIRYTTDRNVVVSNKARRYITNIGFMGELNLLSKRILSDSLTTSAVSSTVTEASSNFIVHARGGLEMVVYKGVFSVYANYNWMALIDNIERFRNQYARLTQIGDKTSFGFIDIGGRILLNPRGGDSKKYIGSGLNIVADFNLIIPRAWGRELLSNRQDNKNIDRFIPVIRLGVRKSLGTLHER